MKDNILTNQSSQVLTNKDLYDYGKSLDILPHLTGNNLDIFADIANSLINKLSNNNLLEENSEELQRVQASKKKLIGDLCDVNQLIPFKDQSYFDAYRDALKNHWVPEEIGMGADILQLQNPEIISPTEMRIVALTLGFFAPADSIVANNIMLNIIKHITLPEARFYLIKQGFEEVLHSHSYIYIIQSYGSFLPYTTTELFNMYHELSPVALKIAWGADKLKKIEDPNFSLVREDYSTQAEYIEAVQQFLTNYIPLVVVMEGIFFYCSFVQVLALSKTGKMRQFAEQIQYIMRDETMHLNMGIKIILDIIRENPEVWTKDFAAEIKTIILEGLYVEMAFASYTIGDGLLGLTKQSMFQYLQYITDNRLSALHLGTVFNVADPFPWMDQEIHIRKEKNFFETRVTDYQSGVALDWDE